MRILAVCGSLQAVSWNLKLLQSASALAPQGVAVTLFDGIRHLPHFNPDLEAAGVPSSVAEWRRQLAGSDALIIASPEYGHSLPGVVKNAVDWVVGSGELVGKVVAITASTAASDRGRLGLAALRTTLGAVDARVLGGEPIVRGPRAESELQRLLAAAVEHVRSAAAVALG